MYFAYYFYTALAFQVQLQVLYHLSIPVSDNHIGLALEPNYTAKLNQEGTFIQSKGSFMKCLKFAVLCWAVGFKGLHCLIHHGNLLH